MTNLANISIKDNSDWNTLLDLVYPIGSYYFSNSSTSPADLLGGSWQILQDVFCTLITALIQEELTLIL